jgi:hypothetical protein
VCRLSGCRPCLTLVDRGDQGVFAHTRRALDTQLASKRSKLRHREARNRLRCRVCDQVRIGHGCPFLPCLRFLARFRRAQFVLSPDTSRIFHAGVSNCFSWRPPTSCHRELVRLGTILEKHQVDCCPGENRFERAQCADTDRIALHQIPGNKHAVKEPIAEEIRRFDSD